MKKAFWGLVATIVASSCSHTEKNEIIEPENLDSEIFISDSLLRKPVRIVAYDESVVISNDSKSDSMLDVYDRNGNLINTLIANGNGPGEIHWISSLQYSKPDNAIYVTDYYKKRLYRIDDFAGENPTMTEVFSYIDPGYDESEPWNNTCSIAIKSEIAKLADGRFIANNKQSAGMFAIFDSQGKLISVEYPYPDKSKVDEKLSDWAHCGIYNPEIHVSPDGKRAALTISEGIIRIFIDLENGKTEYVSMEEAYPNDIFVIEAGTPWAQGAHTRKSKFYDITNSAGNENVYILTFDGKTGEEIDELDFTKDTKKWGMDEVRVFDYSGNLKRILHLDHSVEAIAVTPDEKYLYGLTESSEQGFAILRFKL